MSSNPVIEVQDLKVHFPGQHKNQPVRAIDGVSFEVSAGDFHAIVGESGCGKTTLARTIVGLQKATSGDILIRGQSITSLLKNRKTLARDVQFVFQNPLGALSRRQTVYQSLEEPLFIHRKGTAAERHRRVLELADLVGLPHNALDRLPRSLSGGQRQRVAIARALALNPSILICDEPLSALDVSIQAQIVALFARLQKELGLTIVMITHDLSVVREVCSSVTVMYLGRIMEANNTEQLFEQPAHPYTQALLSSVPSPDPRIESSRQRIVLKGDPPSPMNPPSGCRFHTRCLRAIENCKNAEPALQPQRPSGLIACHLV
ncbi:ATP-binding cassette domain-containing protein [Sansalvadorimonas sp. 2012CJ34-2]|uniref:ATP-binding cassette domain-containing protein n=1 Tax=Parendozoicomonas callyspongiae TaxID=2942213 RepID=A0ABT0PIV7_9GAMM|nr:oligopeptide/dipeptide ABC transporter ATP-binding protein [Sansalvadorimonas sp. 2012CJ34-2]MCL6271325.1 ATP-binding cassette domain-containing protein [Sansalvadorimonas sp. 2012CJ34-2]